MTEHLKALRDLIASDSYAISFQTFGQYRTALLKAIDAVGEPAGAQAGEWRSHPASIDTDWYVSSDGKVLAEVGSINLGGGAPYYAVVGTKRLNHRYVARANAQRDVEAALTTMAAIPEAKEKP